MQSQHIERNGSILKIKRILALFGALLLAGLTILALILALMGAPKNYLMAVLFSMVFIPVILFAMILTVRLLRRSGEDQRILEEIKKIEEEKAEKEEEEKEKGQA